MHLNIGVSRALINQRDHNNADSKNKMRTNCLSQEILYYLGPSHSIGHCLEQYGTKHISQAFFAIFVSASDQIMTHVNCELAKKASLFGNIAMHY